MFIQIDVTVCGCRASVGKYLLLPDRIVREQYFQMISAVCPQPYTTLTAFGTLTQMSGDV